MEDTTPDIRVYALYGGVVIDARSPKPTEDGDYSRHMSVFTRAEEALRHIEKALLSYEGNGDLSGGEFDKMKVGDKE